MTGLVFDVRKYSIHDGPGIRTAFFLKGCPLSCPWCHNPEGLRAAPELFLRPDRCLGLDACGACLVACPSRIALPAESSASMNAKKACAVCGECVTACPTEARQVAGFWISPDQALALALEDEPFYDESGGGVTFSGGEPLAQAAFLLDCLAVFKARRIHTAVDTSGYAPSDVFEKVTVLTDLFLYDLKHMDSREHERWTGVPNVLILENLRILCARGASVWVRIPLIPGVNDDLKNLEAAADYLKTLDFAGHGESTCLRSVQILPYHDSAKGKYALSGRPYIFPENSGNSTISLQKAREVFERRGITAKVGG